MPSSHLYSSIEVSNSHMVNLLVKSAFLIIGEPSSKKFRGHILRVGPKQRSRRLESMFEDMTAFSELEDISIIQAAAMLLVRAANTSQKSSEMTRVSDFAEEVVQKKSPTWNQKKISVPTASRILLECEIGKLPYRRLKKILEGELGYKPVFPGYEQVSSYHKSITPVPEALPSPYSGVRFPLLPALITTMERMFPTIDPVLLSEGKPVEVTFKFGFDGSGGHNIFNQKGAAETNNITMGMICPLLVKCGEERIWKQERPQSQNSHRPLILQLGKETIESLRIYGPVTREMADAEKVELLVKVRDQEIKVKVKVRITALDRKAADAVTGLGGAPCDLCLLSTDELHDEDAVEDMPISRTLASTKALAESLMDIDGVIRTKTGDFGERFGVMRVPTIEKDIESAQGLHLLLRTTDWALKFLYHEIAGVNHWSEGTSKRDTVFIDAAKKQVQEHMREKTGLKVGMVSSGGTSGTTTTGNVARRLLYDLPTRSLLLELVPEHRRENLSELFQRIALILRVTSSTTTILEENLERFKEYCKETYRFILAVYPRPILVISPSLHKLLAHAGELISLNENQGLGTISEGGVEACNKLLRRYRIRLSRKTSQHENLVDCANRL